MWDQMMAFLDVFERMPAFANIVSPQMRLIINMWRASRAISSNSGTQEQRQPDDDKQDGEVDEDHV